MKRSEIKKVAIIGAGMMGTGVAHEFARFGFEVSLQARHEETLKKAMVTAKEDLELMAEADFIPKSMVKEALGRMHPTTNMIEAATGAHHVLESVPEVATQKQEIFAKLDEMLPANVILASNASGMKVEDCAATSRNHPERILITHYWQPAHLIPLVDVIGGEKTSKQHLQDAAELLRFCRKKPILQERAMPTGPAGWANSLQWIVGAQARKLIDEHGCDVYTVDNILRFGFGRRYAFTASYLRLDVIGLDWSYNIDKERGLEPWGPVKERVEKGYLGMKTGKGFYDWPGNTAQEFLRDFNLELIHLLKRDYKRGDL
jgi:3-hydroxybutyryl-CoA dehydrogenase